VGLPVTIALLLAIVAAGALVAAREDRSLGPIVDDGTTVFVATVDIPAHASLDPLIDQGIFRAIKVPNDSLVSDAVTELPQLRGQTARIDIRANMQISLNALESSAGHTSGILPVVAITRSPTDVEMTSHGRG
jgi:hypothetical protein